MLGYLTVASAFTCNSGGAWPFSELPLLGNGLLTVFLTLILGYWAWQTLKNESVETAANRFAIGAWALIVGSGLSHAIERLSGECVLDYWHFGLVDPGFYFNLGDLSLTMGVIYLIVLWQRKRISK